MWHSRPYPSRSWYLIKRPRRDARLSWLSARSLSTQRPQRCRGTVSWRQLADSWKRLLLSVVKNDWLTDSPQSGDMKWLWGTSARFNNIPTWLRESKLSPHTDCNYCWADERFNTDCFVIESSGTSCKCAFMSNEKLNMSLTVWKSFYFPGLKCYTFSVKLILTYSYWLEEMTWKKSQ